MNSNILNLRHLTVLFILCTAFLGGAIPAFAQQGGKKMTGQVIDENKEPMIGVSILIVGTSTGTVTDFDGNYTLNVPKDSKELQFSYVGYETKVIAIPANGNVLNVQMKSDSQVLSDVVVIGYGTQRKSDLTGSVTNVSSKDFNMGLVSSPEQLINGKISGVQIMSNSGSPTSGSTIRVRGGASLNASNDPLIVLDGVPLEQGGISGNDGNFLSLINPNDIESMTILKDASSTAIYGSRASNGVILITTKKGSSDKMKITFSTTNSIQTRTKLADMLSYDQFVNTIRTLGTAAQQALLGTARTDWNDEIYQNAFGTDNNLSITGKIAPNWPIRVSVGYYNQSGLLRTDNAERYTGSVTLNPSFFKDHLKLNINAKGSINNNTFGNTEAIWAASTINPTIPVYSGLDTFGGYTEAVDNTGAPVNGAVMNPVGLIQMNDSHSNVRRFIGNIDADYRVHFFPDLKLHATIGYDYAQGKGSVYVPAEAAQNYTTSGLDYSYGPQKKENRLLTLYANYNKLVEPIKSSFDVTAGYDYQYWKATNPLYSEMNTLGEVLKTSKATDERHVLLSYYGRLNYSFDSRYMLTTTVRRDATSRFAKNVRWGTFPSVALGWRVTEESFLKNNKVLSNLKVRASYGVTGQQDGIGNYNYLPIYTISQNGAESIMGNDYIYTYRPKSYVSDLKWETTTQYNVGFDMGFFNNRLSVTLDGYWKKTKDLLLKVSLPYYTGFTSGQQNVGEISNRGFELDLRVHAIRNKDMNLYINANLAHNENKILKISESLKAYNRRVIEKFEEAMPTDTEVTVPFLQYEEGGSLNSIWGVKSWGISPSDGQEVFIRKNGGLTDTWVASDQVVIGNTDPKAQGSIGFNFTYKRFSLFTSFMYEFGGQRYNQTLVDKVENVNILKDNVDKRVLTDRWKKPGDQAQFKALTQGRLGRASTRPTSRFVQNYNALSWSSLELGYDFGEKITDALHLSMMRMTLGMNDIMHLSSVKQERGLSYPYARAINFSLKVTF
mgnify:CR=1 FL=1